MKSGNCECSCGGRTKTGNIYINHHNRKNKKLSLETRKQMSLTRTGRKLFKEWYINIGLSRKGTTHTQETKNKISKARMGQALYKLTEKMKEMSKEKAYILGCLCGDGFLVKRGRWRGIGITATQLSFVQKFVDCLYIHYKRKIAIIPKRFNNHLKTQYRCHTMCNNIFKDIIKYGHFTCRSWVVPREIREANNECKKEFLNGFFDSECNINKHKKRHEVSVSSINKKGILGIQQLLKEFDIQSSLKYKKLLFVLFISRYIDIKKLYGILKFSIQYKRKDFDFIQHYNHHNIYYKEEWFNKVKNLYYEGKGVREIERQLGINSSTICQWLCRLPNYNPNMKYLIKARKWDDMKRNNIPNYKIAKFLKTEYRTIRKYLQEEALKKMVMIKDMR